MNRGPSRPSSPVRGKPPGVAKFSRRRRRADLARLAARRWLQGAPIEQLEAEYGISRRAIWQARHRMRAAEIASTPEDELTD